MPRHVVNSALRLNLPYFAVACAIALGGAFCLLFARLRSRDRLLLWAGICSLLYAVRLFAQNELVRDAFKAPGNEYIPFALCISYSINIPFALFALELIGRGWRGSIAIWTWLCCIFAVIGVPVSLLMSRVYWIDRTNGVLIVGGTLLLLSHLFLARRTGISLAASLLWPLAVFGLFVVLENKVLGFTAKASSPSESLLYSLGWAPSRYAVHLPRIGS